MAGFALHHCPCGMAARRAEVTVPYVCARCGHEAAAPLDPPAREAGWFYDARRPVDPLPGGGARVRPTLRDE